MPSGRTNRPELQAPICLRRFQRAAENDKTILVDGTMNANSATTPRMMPIKNLTKNGPVGVLKRRCTTPRTHLSLNKDAPISRGADTVGRIICRPILGGLHHQYAWI
jgi:hypothetical protein